MINDASSILTPLLFEQVDRDAFTAGLNTLLREALDLWSQAQKSPERILASTEGSEWDMGWGYHKEHDDAIPLTATEFALIPRSEEPVLIPAGILSWES